MAAPPIASSHHFMNAACRQSAMVKAGNEDHSGRAGTYLHDAATIIRIQHRNSFLQL